MYTIHTHIIYIHNKTINYECDLKLYLLYTYTYMIYPHQINALILNILLKRSDFVVLQSRNGICNHRAKKCMYPSKKRSIRSVSISTENLRKHHPKFGKTLMRLHEVSVSILIPKCGFKLIRSVFT